MHKFVCALLVVFVIAVGAPCAYAAEGSADVGDEARYDAPVDRPVIDPFRPPANPYGPGNRGIDYGTVAGEPVRAAKDGEVVFAGRVGLSLHVVVLHDDGVRTSYSFLSHVDVRRGDHVQRGDIVGLAGDELHFGARVGDNYIDPALLLAGLPPVVHLVPAELRRPASEAGERKGLIRSLLGGARHVASAGASAVAWARDTGVAAVRAGVDAGTNAFETLLLDDPGLSMAMDLWSAYRAIESDQKNCTSRSTAPKPVTRARHIAVLVAGFGSSGGDAAVLDVATDVLGYADGDVAQFSYRGGQAPGDRQLAGIPVNDYGPVDADGDIVESATRLHDLLETIRLRYPGVPVDLYAHSQGGVVVRAALGGDFDDLDPRLPPIDHVVTMGTPQHGTDLADMNASLSTSIGGQVTQRLIWRATGGGVDPLSEAAGDLATRSDFSRGLAGSAPPAPHVTAIAASGDLVVPAPRAVLDDADNVVVPLTGVGAHDRLPGSPQALREIRLALAGQAPTCTSLADVVLGSAISAAEHEAGLLLRSR